MLDDEKFDFSKETKIKDKLLEKCLQKKNELNNKHLRNPVTIDELTGSSKEITKIDKNKSKEKTIKMEKQ